MKRRVLLDTDMGTDVDDALCLALALSSPEIDLVAVTTVSGDTALRSRIAKKILQLAGRDDIPVFTGESASFAPGRSFAQTGHEGEGILAPGEVPTLESETATNAIARLIERHEDLEIVAVGPLTNLAQTLEAKPELASQIDLLTIMGGHVRDIRYGNFSFAPGIDYNLCSDPEASLRVLQDEVPIRLVTGDVTLQTWMRERDLQSWRNRDTAFHRALVRAVEIWTPLQKEIFGGLGAAMDGDNVAFLHDPLTLACVFDPSLCTFEALTIEACLQEGTFRTLERPPTTSSARTMQVATGVDAQRFRDEFVGRIARFGGT